METPIRLTQYSHGAGCGCKISPSVLDSILAQVQTQPGHDARLLVGNDTRDDAAVWDLGNGQALISTTDFFMPIVDHPVTFGRIAATNAISDVYSMGGRPVLAIAILGWPIDKLSPEIAGLVLEGGRQVCTEAGIALAGGHSIDAPEPIFGLAVTGLVEIANLKRNAGAQLGDLLLLTKPLGVGILTTAEKKGVLQPEHAPIAPAAMTRLNRVGTALGAIKGVNALTDVTGFGLLGHLVEMARPANLQAHVAWNQVPTLLPMETMADYIDQKCVPGGTTRNWNSYAQHIGPVSVMQRSILADPQTSGGLLIAISPEALPEAQAVLAAHSLEAHTSPIGHFGAAEPGGPWVRITA